MGALDCLTVKLGDRAYPIYIGQGALSELTHVLRGLQPRGVAGLVTDTNVGPLYGDAVAAHMREAGLEVALCVLPAGEQHKRLGAIEGICEDCLRAGLDRSSVIVALGGGVVGDVAGLAAAVYMRGIRLVQIPTTVVAQVDSSVGGKTGVNLTEAKNIVGAFHQPSAVIVDLNMLKSLPDRELRAGLAEVIKHAVIADEELFGYMEERAEAILAKDLATLKHPILRSCQIKSAVVEADEREQHLRANLNYGHTFGHAIEAASGYAQFLHGEAVALGMCAAAALAEELGLVDGVFVERQRRCIERYGLPTSWPELPLDAVLDAMKHDKKARAGALKFVVAERIGRVVHRIDVTEAQARRALETLRRSG